MDEVEKLIVQLTDPVILHRRDAAKKLAELKDPRAVSELIIAFEDDDWEVTKLAVEALASIGKPAVPALIEALESGSIRAANALARIKDPSAVPALINTLKKRHWNDAVVEDVVEALACIGKPAVPAIKELLKNKQSSLRRAAVKALIADVSTIPILLGILSDEREELLVRGTAVDVLVKLVPRAGTDLSEIRASLQEYVTNVRKERDVIKSSKASRWAASVYSRIAKRVKKAKEFQMGGELLEGKPKPPKGKSGMYRLRRAVT